MSPPLEHDYIGLSALPPPVAAAAAGGSHSDEPAGGGASVLNLKETELRLGLPGSESRDRSETVAVTLELLPKGFASGAKRGFSDAIGAPGKWVFSPGGRGSEADLGKKGGVAAGEHLGAPGSVGKESAGGQEKKAHAQKSDRGMAPAAKAQVVGWPPIRSYRKNTMATNPSKNKEDVEEAKQGAEFLYVKVSMDGAPYLRKVDLKMYNNYEELFAALGKMFSCRFIDQCESHATTGIDGLSASKLVDLPNGPEFVLTFEDKDGDWMLVGDLPWGMFTDSCKRLRIMKGSDAIGLAPRAMERNKN